MPSVVARSRICSIAEHFGIHAAFAIGQRVAVEAGGDTLFDGGVGQQVARELFDRELVKRHVAVERVDHPMAIAPCPGARRVLFKAVAVGVAREVKPVSSPFLAVMRRGEQPVDNTLVSVRPGVGKECFDLRRRRRQPDQVEADPSDQSCAAGFRRRFDPARPRAGKEQMRRWDSLPTLRVSGLWDRGTGMGG